jgi:hypothetical protein
MSAIRVHSANLEDDKELDKIVLRGVLDQETLKFINMAWYQRERGFSTSQINEIMAAYFAGDKIEDITVGMRGQRFRSRGESYVLQDKCYCINGGQRLYAAAAAVRERPGLKIRLGVKVIFDTTEEYENDLFCKMGTTAIRISPSVLLRNKKKRSAAARLLVEMKGDADFALKDRVSWDQRKSRHDLMSGYTFCRIVGALHAHKAGALKSNKLYELLGGLDNLVGTVGAEHVRLNVVRFFDAIDKCWTIRNLSGGRESRPHMKPLFLQTIARLVSRYPEFWNGKERNEFYFGDRYLRRLKGFKVSEYVNSKAVPRDVLAEVLRKRLSLNAANEERDADEQDADAAVA